MADTPDSPVFNDQQIDDIAHKSAVGFATGFKMAPLEVKTDFGTSIQTGEGAPLYSGAGPSPEVFQKYVSDASAIVRDEFKGAVEQEASYSAEKREEIHDLTRAVTTAQVTLAELNHAQVSLQAFTPDVERRLETEGLVETSVAPKMDDAARVDMLRGAATSLQDAANALEAGVPGSESAQQSLQQAHDTATKLTQGAELARDLGEVAKEFKAVSPTEAATMLQEQNLTDTMGSARDTAREALGDGPVANALGDAAAAAKEGNVEHFQDALANSKALLDTELTEKVSALVAETTPVLEDAYGSFEAATAQKAERLTSLVSQSDGAPTAQDSLAAEFAIARVAAERGEPAQSDSASGSKSEAQNTSEGVSISVGGSGGGGGSSGGGGGGGGGGGARSGSDSIGGQSGTTESISSEAPKDELAAAVRGHLEQAGFDDKSIAEASNIADGVRQSISEGTPESALLVLNNDGDVLASIEPAGGVLPENASAISVGTLAYVDEHGMPEQAIEAVKDFVPEATRGATDLEVLDGIGPALADKIQESGLPGEALNAAAKELQDTTGMSLDEAKETALVNMADAMSPSHDLSRDQGDKAQPQSTERQEAAQEAQAEMSMSM